MTNSHKSQSEKLANDKQSQIAERKTGDGRGPGDHTSPAPQSTPFSMRPENCPVFFCGRPAATFPAPTPVAPPDGVRRLESLGAIPHHPRPPPSRMPRRCRVAARRRAPRHPDRATEPGGVVTLPKSCAEPSDSETETIRIAFTSSLLATCPPRALTPAARPTRRAESRAARVPAAPSCGRCLS